MSSHKNVKISDLQIGFLGEVVIFGGFEQKSHDLMKNNYFGKIAIPLNTRGIHRLGANKLVVGSLNAMTSNSVGNSMHGGRIGMKILLPSE